MLNSLFLVAMNTIGELISVPIIAFAFARLRFPAKNHPVCAYAQHHDAAQPD
jgi:ABC-type maltose transport system permease subunit